ncbi:colicin E3-like toxin immunity protein [Proteus mirabilis]|nr:colicin E3-like toxin immunity protein [Proteus mirabilis]MDU6046781.1 colicin E3-like toxin immunity protein [Proteus mirabilis]
MDPKNENVINNGEFDLKKEWINAIQKHVTYKINPAKYTYFIAFDYRDKW